MGQSMLRPTRHMVVEHIMEEPATILREVILLRKIPCWQRSSMMKCSHFIRGKSILGGKFSYGKAFSMGFVCYSCDSYY